MAERVNQGKIKVKKNRDEGLLFAKGGPFLHPRKGPLRKEPADKGPDANGKKKVGMLGARADPQERVRNGNRSESGEGKKNFILNDEVLSERGRGRGAWKKGQGSGGTKKPDGKEHKASGGRKCPPHGKSYLTRREKELGGGGTKEEGGVILTNDENKQPYDRGKGGEKQPRKKKDGPSSQRGEGEHSRKREWRKDSRRAQGARGRHTRHAGMVILSRGRDRRKGG